MNIFIPWRTWTSRATTPRVSSEKYPISRVCPSCGSGGYTRIGQSITVPFAEDRQCVNCSTRYAPRQGKAAGVFFILLGMFLIIPFGFAAGDAVLGLLHLNPDKAFQPTVGSAFCPGVIALTGAWFLHYGIRAFRRPKVLPHVPSTAKAAKSKHSENTR